MSLALVPLLAASPALASVSADSVLRFAGKFHPLIVHFPIALLLVAAGMEFLRRRSARVGASPGAGVCLRVGAAAAVVAAFLGWFDAFTAGHTGTDAGILWWHRWVGVVTAGVAVAAVAASLGVRGKDAGMRARRDAGNGRGAIALYRLGLVLSALLVGLSGHLGASLIYGPDYVARAFEQLRSPVTTAPDGVAGSGAASGGAMLTAAGSGGMIDYARDVQPILARRCFQCHAGDKPENGLRLDARDRALKGGRSGNPAIVPGNAAASRMIRLVSGLEEGKQMPPKGGALEAAQIETLTAWINRGAAYGAGGGTEGHWHWAYRAPVRPNLPVVKDTYWARNAIDSFVLARLEAEGLKPSPEAMPETLIRRVSLDLTGLPPTIEEVDAYLAEVRAGQPDAYERVVDRLLASARYGERWARMWLDVARYADTNGYEKDDRRSMWAWRDWVIGAFNRDMPFDEFTVKQLAGDLLDASGAEAVDNLVATGFSRNTMVNEEGGVDPEEFRCDSIVDRVNTMAGAWLGSTLQCAQCHNHKNDPFTQEEYYRLFAFFNGDDSDVVVQSTGSVAAGAMVEVVPAEKRGELAAARKEIAGLESELGTTTEALDAEQGAWEREYAAAEPAWTVLMPTAVSAAPGGEGGAAAVLTVGEDGSITVSGASPERDTYTVEVVPGAGLLSVASIRLEVLPGGMKGSTAIGRTGSGNLVLSEITVGPAGGSGAEGGEYAMASAVADYEQDKDVGHDSGWPAPGAIDHDPKTGWAIGGQTDRAHAAVFGLASAAPAGPLKITLVQNYGGKHTIGRFRLLATADPRPRTRPPLSPEISSILEVAGAQRNDEQRTDLAKHFRSIAPSLGPARERLAVLRKQVGEMKMGATLVMRQRGEPRDTFVHIRGNFLSHGQPVTPGVPAVLHKLPPLGPGERPTRLTLARWITDPANPLTARVTVNRFWEQYFGRGIVETSDDFGTQGDPPSHPELLDWLATEFAGRQKWSMKAVHRLIVTSATYRQASAVTPELLERDPRNRLLARGARFRVEAEMVRDVALAAGGLLSPKMGGPSVFPPQPEGVWTMIYNDDKWVPSKGEDRYRRGVYTFWRRTAPFPTFTSFDAPSREITCTRRARTNTPLQALATLNDAEFVEAAAALARRTLRETPGADARARLVHAFRLCVARAPAEAEAGRLLTLLEEQLGVYRADGAAAAALVAASQPPDPPAALAPDPTLDPAELAAWIVVANVLLNLDETLTKG